MSARLSPIALPMLFLGLVGCASHDEAQRNESPFTAAGGMNTNYKPGSRTIHVAGEDDEPDTSGMTVEAEEGTLDQGEVDRALQRAWRSMQSCYTRAGDTQRYVGGQVLLRFMVAASGQVSDIHVIENGLGNYAVERCLVVEGRRIQFSRPKGGKSAQFEYPIRFQSTGEMAVVDWQPESLRTQIGPLFSSLGGCPSLGPDEVTAIVYIEPNGEIGSAGLVSSGPIDPEGGVCALEQVRKWKLSGESGHVVRTSFALRAGGAAEAPARAHATVATKTKKVARRRR